MSRKAIGTPIAEINGYPMTDREIFVFQQIADGKILNAIPGVHKRTVDTMLTRWKARLEARSITNLIVKLVKLNIL